jgi:hypothetical protein
MTTRRHFAPLRLDILVPADAPRSAADRIRTQRPAGASAVRNAAYQDRVTAMMAGWARQTAV